MITSRSRNLRDEITYLFGLVTALVVVGHG